MSTILVVDDELAVRSLLRDILEIEGHEVLEAEDGRQALAVLKLTSPDLVILDIMMPGMSGIEVLTEVRAQPSMRTLPVLLLSAAGDDETTWAGWTAGASTYLNKPFDHMALLSWIDLLLAPVVPTGPTEPDLFADDDQHGGNGFANAS